MDSLIMVLQQTTRLYKSPNRKGDILEYKGSSYLIIGIESIEIYYSKLKVSYICQNISADIAYKYTPEPQLNLREFYQKIYEKDDYDLLKLRLGKHFYYEGKSYQVREYTDIEFEHTDLVISFYAAKIHPIPHKEAKSLYRTERKKKLSLIED